MRIALAAVLLCFAAGCISAPPPKPNLVELARRQNAVGADLARQFESKLHYVTDPEVNRYLDGIASMLAATSQDPRLAGVPVAVISDLGKQWRSFGLPGRRIYLPIGLLRQLRFDNEVAAVIALEDANVILRHAIDHLAHESASRRGKTTSAAAAGEAPHVTGTEDFLGPSGIFSFDGDEMKESVRTAIQLMYGAGFDIRGLLEIWLKLQANPARSPYSPKVVEELLDFTRSTISLYAPLRNPIVGSVGFKTIRKRIERL